MRNVFIFYQPDSYYGENADCVIRRSAPGGYGAGGLCKMEIERL